MPKTKQWYNTEWRRKHCKIISFYLNIDTDMDVLYMIKMQKNRRQYILKLVRADIEAKKQKIEELQKERR